MTSDGGISVKARTLALLTNVVTGLVSATVFAADVYVSPTGSDSNAGTQSSPYLTIAKAYSTASAGTTIYLRAGVYQPSSKIVLNKSGSSGNPIRLFAFAGETPIIDGTKESERWRSLVEVTGNYNHLRGIEIRNASNMGLSILGSGSGNVIEQLNVHHSGRIWDEGSGISIFGTAANNLLLNNDSHHNYAALVVGNADGMRSSSRGTGNVLRGNRVYKNADDGFDMWNGTPTILEGNVSFENGYDDNFKRLGDGNGFKLGGNFADATSGGHTLFGNVAFRNPMHGFDENQATNPFTMYNNTAYSNGPDMPGGVTWAANFGLYKSGHVVRNNASLGKLGEINGTSSNNSWNLASGITAADFLSLDDKALRGPRNADGSLPVSNFLRPSASSRLIDRGVSVGRPYAGSAPDIGAYESGTTAPSPTPTPSPTPAPTSTPVIAVIRNGSFENGDQSWENWGNTSLSREYARQGEVSLKVSGEGGRGQVVSLKAGSSYTLKFSGKRRANGGESCTVSVSLRDVNNREIPAPYASITSRNSVNFSLRIQIPAQAVSAKVFVWKDAGSNACYVDNFSF